MEKKDLIVIIANKYQAEEIVGFANTLGANGATVVNGRVTTKKEVLPFLDFTIEPEKELIFMTVNNDLTANITSAIKERFTLNQPNKGILFVIPVKKYRGLNNE